MTRLYQLFPTDKPFEMKTIFESTEFEKIVREIHSLNFVSKGIEIRNFIG